MILISKRAKRAIFIDKTKQKKNKKITMVKTSSFSATFLVTMCMLFNIVMSKVTAGADAKNLDGTGNLMRTNVGVITRKQAGIWVPIVFAIISVAAVYALFAIDDKKNRDTILYAKFLANLKDR